MMLDKLTSKDFSAYLDDKFYLQFEGQESLELELIDVNELGSGPPGGQDSGQRRAFAVVFRGSDSESYLPQQIYRIEHEKLGTLDLFLVPVGPDRHGMCYEAVFT